MSDIRPYLDTLAGLALPEGGWPYAPGRAARLEPTCLSLLAMCLDAERYTAVIDAGLATVRSWSLPDGLYRAPGDRDEVTWPSALALFVQNAYGKSPELVQKTAERLLALEGKKPDEKQTGDIHDIDVKLTGWPWAEGNFSWVEPTAWACIALRSAGQEDHPHVQEGLKLLVDRAFDDGGVNYGNRMVLGKRTEPIPGPTALMLIALQGHGDKPRVRASVQYLLHQALQHDDLEHLCWAKLALDCHRDQDGVEAALPRLDERIRDAYQARKETNWVQPSSMREALTALALGASQKNPFRLSRTERSANGTAAPAVLKIGPKKKSWTERLAAKFRGMAIEAAGRLRQVGPKSDVHIAPATDYNGDLGDVVRRQYESFRARVPLAGKRVVLKPNLVEYRRDRVINTHPNVVAAVIELCRREGAAEVIVAEGPGHWRNVEYLAQASGLGDVLRHYKVPFVDLNHDEPVKTPNLGRLTGLEHLYLTRTIATADVVISLPKLKTHHWACATLSLKNLFGTLPGICYGWPKNELHWRGIDNSIVDIALTRTPDLAIVDGIIGMEGDGPLNGTAKPFGALIMGNDLLAVDVTCCRLMELNPERIGYLVMGYQKKLGLLHEHEIEQLGETITQLRQPFETVPHFNELRLARSA